MDVRSIEYTIYCNLFKYIDIIGYKPIKDLNSKNKTIKHDKKELIKILQFYSYVRIKNVKKDSPDELMYVFLVSDSAFTSKSIEFKKLLNTIPDKKASIVIVSRVGLKTVVKKFLKSYKDKTLYVRDLLYEHFKVDIRTNVMVPKHVLCTPEETKKVMIDNKIDNIYSFPKIRQNDPQVLWIGGRPKQLIKIVRRDVTGEVLYYRVII